jgi:hypothetical protein
MLVVSADWCGFVSDAMLMPCSQIIKYIDQVNISNAYVSGMQEDLGLNSNQLNYFTTYFSVGCESTRSCRTATPR